MNMKRFLILFILTAFVSVGCASQARWTKSDFSRDNLEEDWDRCIAMASYSLGKTTVDECMNKKGYTSLSKKDPYRTDGTWTKINTTLIPSCKIDEGTGKYFEVIATLLNPYVWAIVITEVTIGLPIKLVVGLLEE
jgi:hypothetical protein